MMPSSSILHALTWRWKTPTVMAERAMSAVGVRTASERLRQRSASSPASSSASGGARVRARVEEGDNDRGKCEFIGIGAALCYYTGAPGDSHLRNVAIMWYFGGSSTSHARLDCRAVVPASPDFMWRNEH